MTKSLNKGRRSRLRKLILASIAILDLAAFCFQANATLFPLYLFRWYILFIEFLFYFSLVTLPLFLFLRIEWRRRRDGVGLILVGGSIGFMALVMSSWRHLWIAIARASLSLLLFSIYFSFK